MEQFINEIWKPIKENPVYLVSNYGRVKTIDHPIWCKVNNSYSIRKGRLCILSNNNSKKYWRVGIQINNKQKHIAVHRLVAEVFIPNPNNLSQINHIDGNKNNNHVSNLEWCDNSYNQKHAWDKGLKNHTKMSKNSSFRKLTLEQTLFIKEVYNEVNLNKRGLYKQFCLSCCELFNLNSISTIHWIVTNGTNKFINQDIVQTTNFDVYKEQFYRIFYRNVNSKPKTIREIARELNVNENTFRSRYRNFNKDLDRTINSFIKSGENHSSKESTSS